LARIARTGVAVDVAEKLVPFFKTSKEKAELTITSPRTE